MASTQSARVTRSRAQSGYTTHSARQRCPGTTIALARTMLKWPSARGRFSEEIRPMDEAMIATHLENIEHRLGKVEQILPTLARKEELRLAIANAVAPLATKEELRLAIAPLATKEELRLAIAEAVAPLATKAEVQEFRRHMD